MPPATSIANASVVIDHRASHRPLPAGQLLRQRSSVTSADTALVGHPATSDRSASRRIFSNCSSENRVTTTVTLRVRASAASAA